MTGSRTFRGRIFTGVGKGGYYVGHPEYKKRFKKLLGYVPYPGTLNIRLDSSDQIRARNRLLSDGGRGVRVEEFTYKGERFSAVNCFAGVLDRCKVTLLMIAITHYDDSVLELISPVYLRGELDLKDGDAVSVQVDA